MSEIEIVHEPEAPEVAATPPVAPSADVPETPRINKRIQQLVARATAAEQRAEAAVAAATKAEKTAEDRVAALEARFTANEARAAREATIRNSYAVAEQAYRSAREAGDVGAETRAQAQLVAAQAEWAVLNGQPTPVAAAPAPAAPAPTPAPAAPAPRAIPDLAKRYMADNEWFGKDRVQTAVAVALSEDLTDEGYDPATAEYYQELDKRRAALAAPATTPAAKTRSPVAPSGAPAPAANGKVRVTLSAEERDMARRLGLTEEVYATHKAALTSEKPHGEQGPEMISWRAA